MRRDTSRTSSRLEHGGVNPRAVHTGAAEFRQKSGMYVDYPPVESPDEDGGNTLHVSGEHEQLDPVGLECPHQRRAVVCCVEHLCGSNCTGCTAERMCSGGMQWAREITMTLSN